MKNQLFMGIDIGTSGIRAVAFDIEGRQVSVSHREYSIICDDLRKAELDPDVIFKAFLDVSKGCVEKGNISGDSIAAIGISSQMHSFMAVDKDGNGLTNLITWADTRPIDEAEYIRDNFSCSELYGRTGCRVQHPMYPLSKILWLKRKMPDIYKRAYKFISIKEYIIYKLFGEYLIDITNASATGYFNINEFQWDKTIINDVLKTQCDRFSEPVDCTHVLTGMKSEYAVKMGIGIDTPVVIGSGDGMMANAGCGVFDDTSMSSTIGTSGAVRTAVKKPVLDPEQRTWCYCFTRDTWVSGGAISNGGIVLNWLMEQYKEQFQHEAEDAGLTNAFSLFNKYASDIKPGSDGMLFLPYIMGERAPGWHANAEGFICGMRISHNKKHVVRAAMEGIMFNMYSVYKMLENLNVNVDQVIANGGYTNSDAWLQIQADIFNKKIWVSNIREASALGAAYTAMAAVGAIKSLKCALPVMKPVKVITPNDENVKIYKDVYKQFMGMYSMLIIRPV